MSTTTDLVFFVLALGLSIVSSLVLARDIEKIGRRFDLPEPLLGLLAALGADSPEISAAISALQSGHHDIGAGIVVGSNLFNLAALLGLSAVVANGIRIRRAGLMLNASAAIGVTAVAVVLIVTRLSGLFSLGLVLLVFLPYVAVISLRPERVAERAGSTWFGRYLERALTTAERDAREDRKPPKAQRDDFLTAIPALASVALASIALVHTTTELGGRYHVPDVVIGTLVLATLTGIPNLVAAVRLAKRRRGSAAVSEALNSNTINIVVGLVVPAVMVGIARPSALAQIGAAWLLGLTVLTALLTGVRGGLLRSEGLVVIGVYLGYVGLVLAG